MRSPGCLSGCANGLLLPRVIGWALHYNRLKGCRLRRPPPARSGLSRSPCRGPVTSFPRGCFLQGHQGTKGI